MESSAEKVLFSEYKVKGQNNILYTLREASNVDEKAIFRLSFQAPLPSLGLFGPLYFKKKFGAQINVKCFNCFKCFNLMSQLYYCIESHFFTILTMGGGGNSKFFKIENHCIYKYGWC